MVTAYRETAENVRAQLRAAEIDVESFIQPLRPCAIDRCRATCCYDGVYLTPEEAAGVRHLAQEQKERLAAYGLSLPPEPVVSVRGGQGYKTAVRSAEPGELAADYPTHFPQTRCVFLDRQGYCGLQRWSMEEGRGDWFDKPLTCWIHPVALLPRSSERAKPRLTLHSAASDPQQGEGYPGFASCTHCGRAEPGGLPAYEVLEAELTQLSLLSGRDLLGEIQQAL